ncbi:hypothetical protein [Bacillus infantis]|uniref:hypothetical protein n=1 Tax=Bacillus infantis TaxID=324767 RepID=UPI003CFAE4ED
MDILRALLLFIKLILILPNAILLAFLQLPDKKRIKIKKKADFRFTKGLKVDILTNVSEYFWKKEAERNDQCNCNEVKNN